MLVHGQRLPVCTTRKNRGCYDCESTRHHDHSSTKRTVWDSNRDHYTYLYGSEQSPDTTLSVGAILPLILARTPKDRIASVMERYFTDVKHFWRPSPVPSVSASESSYDAESEAMIRRGPIFMNLNWLLTRGFKTHGYTEEAKRISERSKEAAFKDFRKFYSPETGSGIRGAKFGWATAAVEIDA